MIYGLYLSASGIIANSYRQDVLANNLANSETTGFKRDLALFKQRQTALQERHQAGDWSDPLLEKLGGGLLANSTLVDNRQGELEATGNPLDMAIEGDGFFAVNVGNETRLSRNGNMITNSAGELILANGHNNPVLDVDQKPIRLQPGGTIAVSKDGTITQDGKAAGRIGLFDVSDRSQLQQVGGTLLSFGNNTLSAGTGQIRSEFVERANVDPTNELAELMDTQRQLEANANMIRYQDSTLQRLVNDVGKIS